MRGPTDRLHERGREAGRTLSREAVLGLLLAALFVAAVSLRQLAILASGLASGASNVAKETAEATGASAEGARRNLRTVAVVTVRRLRGGSPFPTGGGGGGASGGSGSGAPTRVLTVPSGETHFIASGRSETYKRADIDGTLTVDGTLTLAG